MAICEKDGLKFYLICGKEKMFENEIEGHTTNYIKVESKKKIEGAPVILKVVPTEYKNGSLIC